MHVTVTESFVAFSLCNPITCPSSGGSGVSSGPGDGDTSGAGDGDASGPGDTVGDGSVSAAAAVTGTDWSHVDVVLTEAETILYVDGTKAAA